MKYSEFEREMWKLNLEAIENSPHIEVWENRSELLLVINKNMRYRMNVRSLNFERLSASKQELLFNLAVELASTPLEEREDEKQYYIKLNAKRHLENQVYLMKYSDKAFDVDWSPEKTIKSKTEAHRYRFTEKEIKDFDERYWAFAEEVKEDE